MVDINLRKFDKNSLYKLDQINGLDQWKKGNKIGLPGHAIAGVKDIQNPQNEGWVTFNDRHVKKQEHLNERDQECTHVLLYSLL